MFGRGAHHFATQSRTAGKENQIETFGQQSLVHLAMPLNNSNISIVEIFAYHLVQHLRHIRHVRRRFQNSRTTRGNGSHQRVQQQLHRIVPRRHNQGTSQRHGLDKTTRGKHFQRRGHNLLSRPTAQVFQMLSDFGINNTDFGKIGFLIGFVQILPKRFAKRLFPLFEHREQMFQHLSTERNGAGFTAGKILALRSQGLRNVR